MRTVLSLAALAAAGLALAPPVAAQEAAGAVASDGATCVYDSLTVGEREILAARMLAEPLRGADLTFGRSDPQLGAAQARCESRLGWTPTLAGLAAEFARVALMRDGFRRMLREQGVASETIEAWHRDHRASLAGGVTPRLQAAFTAELQARGWAAADASDSAIDLAVGYLGMLGQLEWCSERFAALSNVRQAEADAAPPVTVAVRYSRTR